MIVLYELFIFNIIKPATENIPGKSEILCPNLDRNKVSGFPP